MSFNKLDNFIKNWETKFTNRIEQAVKSRKEVFLLSDAIKKSTTKNRRSELDEVMIHFLEYIGKNPLNKNDYFKYLNSYKKGKELNIEYFKHDKELLFELYNKIDESPDYSPFSIENWKTYVLFMLLKFNNVYEPKTMDEVFSVKVNGSREYNPLTKLTRPLRGMLPSSLKLVQYDISRAYPTFIDMELSIERKEDVYSLIDKRKFNMLLNTHKECKNAKIEAVRGQLRPVYGKRVNEVITEDRFNNKGKLFEDLSKYEKKYINKFIKANNIKNFVRLHDAIFVDAETEIKELVFDKITFKKSDVEPPEVVNDKRLFYEIDGNNKVKTSPVSYKDFFEQENFIRVSIKDEDTITIFKDSNNVVKPFNHKTDTVSFLKSKVNECNPEPIENKIAKDNNKDIKDSFCLLDAVPLTYYRDNANSFGIPFKNGFVFYKKDSEKLEVIPYKKVNGFFPEHPTQKREFKYIEEPQISIFERFLTLVSVGKDPIKEALTEDEQKTQFQFFRMFGYLLHTYKDPSFSPSIILSDFGADDNSRNGRRGKSLLAEAIKQVQRLNEKRGNEFDGGYRHRFADLTEADKVYLIDDVMANFNYNDLYTNIVGSISVEPKGKKARTIDFKQTPKFLITTNWAVRYDANASSTNARFMEFKFVDYFNIKHKPVDYFKHRFFEDWNAKQWNEFYNFCFSCVASFIEFGLDAPKYDKDVDNYRAYFYNDTLLNEFERILNEATRDNEKGFNVSEFLRIYNTGGNTLRFEKFFTSKNTKTLIDTYLKHHKIEHKYREDLKKWFVN
ncbi:hypothetical protein [Psychroflexus planctonicus]|uniref:SF3 helicase domain-containing protein n=1 Tax=Psychroflexus planctonicus TaxID=1526575 RepID=A0ABQ1SDX3_9FLAO|nr:hypothetical protein [Psychroflexus planctonicus]GGE25579.1 hypothetical protein GCM10010832_02900 [Psychroflexus planctonicus]